MSEADHNITEIPLRLQKKLARVCVRPGCEATVVDADECPPHHEDSKARKRGSASRRRAERRKKKRCIDCGRKAKRQRCPGCYRKSRGVAPSRKGVDKSADKPAGNWREDPGTNWMRFRGKGRRGRLTREEQIDEDIRDAGFAIKELQAFVEKAAQLKHPDLINLPAIQRAAARREVGQHLGFAGRIVDELADKYG